MQIPSYKQLTKYILGFGGIQCLNILIALVRNKFISIILGPSGIGLISLFQSGITLIQNSTNFGLSQSGVRTISIAYEEENTAYLQESISMIRSWSMLTAILGFCTCFILSGALSMFVFSSMEHTLDFIMLSPIVALAAITGGEMAILKAVRQLKTVAKLSTLTALTALITAIPLFYFLGTDGIIPALLIASILMFFITISYSYKQYPVRISFKKNFLLKGKDTLFLGLAFVGAGILGSGAEFIIRTFLNRNGGEAVVGLYNAGYMLAFSYAGIAFAAFDNEYFPRLSRLCEEGDKLNIKNTIVKQIKVSLLFIVPMVMILIPLLPYIIPLLFSSRFNDVIPMAQITMLAMIVRAITLPVEYLPLAKGDSKSYLLMESIYDIIIATLVCYCYSLYGITGTGFAIVTGSILSMLFNILYVKYKYL